MIKTVKNFIIGAIISGIIGLVFTTFSRINENTTWSKIHSNDIKKLDDRILELEKNQRKMDDTYVTRRELTIILENINNNTNNINKAINSIDNKLDNLTEKIYNN